MAEATIQIQGSVTDFNARLAELKENIVKLKYEMSISSRDIKNYWQTVAGGVTPVMKDVVEACKKLTSEFEKAAKRVSQISTVKKSQSSQSLEKTGQKSSSTATSASLSSAGKQSGASSSDAKAEEGKTALKKWAEEAQNVSKQMDNLFTKTFNNMTDALVEFTMTGKLNFKDLADSIIKDLLRMAYQAMLSPFASWLSGWVKSLPTSLLSSSSSGSIVSTESMTSSLYSDLGEFAFGSHGGGVVGSDSPSFYRLVPSFAFAGARRYHTGLAGDEFPAILQKGESVFTKGQTQALGGLIRGTTTGEATINKNTIIISAADARSFGDMCKRNPDAIAGPILQALQDNRIRRRMKDLIGR